MTDVYSLFSYLILCKKFRMKYKQAMAQIMSRVMPITQLLKYRKQSNLVRQPGEHIASPLTILHEWSSWHVSKISQLVGTQAGGSGLHSPSVHRTAPAPTMSKPDL